MKFALFFFISAVIFGCTQNKLPIIGETQFQRELNSKFKDASESPLTERGLKEFKGLEFFTFDSTYVIIAHLKRTPDSGWFNMKTTTNRVSKERIFGVLSFNFEGQKHELNVYQGAETMHTEGYENYLFLPFLDDTNGETTYGGGRYIDLKIPDGETMTIDFNKAYNPYCVYNKKYSCPIVPRANYLETRIKAGVKAYKN